MRKYATEFLGTFFLVFTICTTVLTNAALAPLAIGLVLAALVFAGGHVSGAHYNPAVTVAVYLRGRMTGRDIAPYMAAQVLGAAGGAQLARWMVGPAPVTAATITGKPAAVAFVAELAMTFVLAYVVLNVATSKGHPDNSFYGLAIGFTVTAGAIAVGGLSGAVFNPAVAVAVASVGMVSWSSLWLYFVASLAGGALAAGAFRLLNPTDHEKPSRPAAIEQIQELERLGRLDPIGGANPDLVDAATPAPTHAYASAYTPEGAYGADGPIAAGPPAAAGSPYVSEAPYASGSSFVGDSPYPPGSPHTAEDAVRPPSAPTIGRRRAP